MRQIAWVASGLVGLAMAHAGGVLAAEPVDDKNWQQHPAVRHIRALYAAINGDEKAGKLKKQARECELHEGSVVVSGALYTDRHSVVRKYVVDAGSEDSRAKAEYYYDEKGVPRFTYRFRGAFNGTKVEERIYFDEHGKHLYTNVKEEGPGYNDSGLTDAVADPKADYAELCKE